MDEIPDEIMRTAQATLAGERAHTTFLNSHEEDEIINAFASAILNERERANLDAKRYRWLRDGNAYEPEEHGIRGGEALDRLCDKEMAAIRTPDTQE